MSVNATYTTGRGDQRSAELTDGTRIKLDATTRLSVSFDPFTRRIHMVNGEAEFDIGKDWRPFRLDAQKIQVLDRGTRFTVRERGGLVRVVLIQGQVELRDAGAGRLLARLTPGQQATASGGEGVSIERADLFAALAWKDRRLVFRNVSLAAALEEVRARTPVEISLADPALGLLKVSGVYDAVDTTGFINAICALYPLSAQRVGPAQFVLHRDLRRTD
jgi:transmembrane sensor